MPSVQWLGYKWVELYLCTSSAAMLHGDYRDSFTFTVDILHNSLNIYRRVGFERKLQRKEAHILYLIQFTAKSYGFLDN